MYIPYVLDVPYVHEGFLRSIVVYLKDLSPYLRQFLPYSDFQNIIRVNLLGKPTLLVINILLTILYLYTQPISAPTVVLLLGIVIQLLPRLQQKKSNNIPPKAVVTTPLTAAITSRTGGDTSISNNDLQMVTRGQLQEMVDRLIDNNTILKNRLNDIGI